MRRATSDTKIITDAGGNLIRVEFGYGFCSEHEWGIKGILHHLGVPGVSKRKLGIKARTITNFEKDRFKLAKIDEDHILTWSYAPFVGMKNIREIPRELQGYSGIRAVEGQKVFTAWSSKDFGIRVKGDAKILSQLLEAFERRDVAVWVAGRNNPFGGSGLILAVVSNVPSDTKKAMLARDKSTEKLKKKWH